MTNGNAMRYVLPVLLMTSGLHRRRKHGVMHREQHWGESDVYNCLFQLKTPKWKIMNNLKSVVPLLFPLLSKANDWTGANTENRDLAQ